MENYFGGKPYVFVSYSHEDSQKVVGIIEDLAETGVRLWYDGALPHIDDYNEAIATAIDCCSLFLLFVSKASMASGYVRDEIYRAMNNDKNGCVVLLDNATIPRGIQLRIDHINRLDMNSCDREAMIESLCEAFSACRGYKRVEPMKLVPSEDMIRKLVQTELDAARKAEEAEAARKAEESKKAEAALRERIRQLEEEKEKLNAEVKVRADRKAEEARKSTIHIDEQHNTASIVRHDTQLPVEQLAFYENIKSSIKCLFEKVNKMVKNRFENNSGKKQAISAEHVENESSDNIVFSDTKVYPSTMVIIIILIAIILLLFMYFGVFS